jgi:hypothetical protein
VPSIAEVIYADADGRFARRVSFMHIHLLGYAAVQLYKK